MEIKKILIANRGEIAIRIIRTCKEMGIQTVALCPRPGEEENFLETKFADEFCYLEEDGILGYLDQKKIIQIAKKSAVQAIHPGYGFLAENGDFADLCSRNGIKFIGPSGDILRRFGNKIEAKKIAREIKCPLLPATQDPVKSEEECVRVAKKLGTPFLLKASNGGGGVGIKVIKKINKNDISNSFQKLKREVKNAFGSDEIFIERYLSEARHIEFQILGDGKGKVIHFGERECSVQRRHQKLIEEAPSPFLDRKLRKKMGKYAVKIGRYLNYEGLGTVEFLVDKDKNFYFMEVNPRIQVEHPVTEFITGFDLVAEQIKVAEGKNFEIKQGDIKFSGWAMEFRINSEDPWNNFSPRAGAVNKYIAPGGSGVEMHTFCHDGQEVFPYFDSLLAKLVVFGKDRPNVIRKAKRAFSELSIEGISTLIPFFKIVLLNKNFVNGAISTSFIQKEKIVEQLKKTPEEEDTKECLKETKKEEVAYIVAHLYKEMQKQSSKEAGFNKWKSISRQNFLADKEIF